MDAVTRPDTPPCSDAESRARAERAIERNSRQLRAAGYRITAADPIGQRRQGWTAACLQILRYLEGRERERGETP